MDKRQSPSHSLSMRTALLDDLRYAEEPVTDTMRNRIQMT